MKKAGLVFLCMTVLVSFAFAGQKNTRSGTGRQLSEKIGLGFNVSFAHFPALASRYWLTDIAGIEGFLGFRIDDNHNHSNSYVVGGKFLYVIKSYKNVNVFSTASLALHAENRTYVVITSGLGIEWFVLDELSLSTESGISFRAGGGMTSLETNVENIPKISIKYYL